MNNFHISLFGRKVSGRGLKWSSFLILSAVLATSGFFIYNALAGIPVTPATGGETVSIDTTSGGESSAWTTLSGPRITEGNAGDIGLGTHTLTLPAGWEFNTGQNVTIGLESGGSAGLRLATYIIAPAATTLSFYVDVVSGASPEAINFTGIKVRPTNQSLGSGNITATAGTIAGVVNGTTNFGTLITVVGTPTQIKVETAANGSGTVVSAQSVVAGSNIPTAYSIQRDQFDHFVSNSAVTWSTESKTGGIVDGDLVAAGDDKSAVFTGHFVGTALIRATDGALTRTDSGTITVTPAAPGTPTAAAGPYINSAEETGGFDVVAPLGSSGAIIGDTLELLLGGAPFPAPLTRVLDADDIAAGLYTFNVASGQLGADGAKSITSKVTDGANTGPESSALALTLDIVKPTISSVTVNDNSLIQSDVGVNAFDITIVFTDTNGMDNGTAPTIAFDPTLGTTLTNCDGTWVDDTYTYTCDIEDGNIEETDVDIDVSGAKDTAGNTMDADTTSAVDEFDVDTITPTATAAVNPDATTVNVGDDVTVTLTAGGAQADLTVGACTVNTIDVSGTFINNANGTYTLIYTVAEGHSDWTSGNLPISCVLDEPLGNSVTIVAFDANTLVGDANTPSAPVITSIATDNYINNSEKAAIVVVGTAEANALISVTLTNGANSKTGTQQLVGDATDFSITIDGTAAAPAPLADGTITPSVTAQDAAGNTSAADTDPTATQDTVDPAAPVITTFTDPINDANKTTITLDGTGEANATLNYSISSSGGGGTVTGTIAINGAGNYSKADIDVSALPDGTLTATVNVTDAAGNTGGDNTDTATKDVAAPDAPVITSIATDNYINNSEKAAIVVVGTAEANALVGVTLGDGVNSKTGTEQLVGGATGFSITIDGTAAAPGALTDGTITPSTTAQDAAGNTSAADTDPTATQDTVAPTLAQVTPVSTPIKDTTPDYTFSSNEAGTITYAGGCTSATTVAVSGNNTITFTALADGTYGGCTITVTDAAGNNSGPNNPLSVTSFTIDTVVPVISSLVPSNGATTFDATPEIGTAYADASAGIDTSTVVITVDGTDVTAFATVGANDISYMPVSSMTNGIHTVTVDVNDLAGNSAIQASWSFAVASSGMAVTTDATTVVADDSTQAKITAQVLDVNSDPVTSGGVNFITNIGTISSATVALDANGEAVTYIKSSEIGLSIITASFNAQSGTTNVTFTQHDGTAPIISNLDVDTDPAGIGDVLNITFDVNEPLAGNPAVTVDGNNAVFSSKVGLSYRYTYTVTGNETEGEVTVLVSAEDTFNNVGAGSKTDLTLDFSAPSFTVNEGTDAGPVQTDTINITVVENNAITASKYGFSADATCNSSDTYGNVFTSGVSFDITGNHTDYLCVMATNDSGNTGYQLVGLLNVDNTAPTVTVQYPTDNSTSIVVSVNPYIDFSEVMDGATLIPANVNLRLYDTTTVISSTYNISTNSNGTTRLTFIPNASLAYNTHYYFFVGTAVKDQAGNAFAANTWYVGNQASHEFTTIAENVPVTSYNIPLSIGWNLISLPLIPGNTSIGNVLAGISGNVIIVRYYNASSASWLSYVPGAGGNTLTTMEDGKGYWINMNATRTLTVNGVEMPGPEENLPTYPVVEGWNLIGFKSVETQKSSEYLSGLSYVIVYGYNGAYFTVAHPTNIDNNMTPGSGYWAYFSAAGIIIP